MPHVFCIQASPPSPSLPPPQTEKANHRQLGLHSRNSFIKIKSKKTRKNRNPLPLPSQDILRIYEHTQRYFITLMMCLTTKKKYSRTGRLARLHKAIVNHLTRTCETASRNRSIGLPTLSRLVANLNTVACKGFLFFLLILIFCGY